jgi:hypothetical protein
MTIEKLFPRNENGVDRMLRIVIGIALLALVFAGPKTYWGLVGLVPLVTGLLGSCPLYTLLGIGTCPARRGTKGAGTWTGGARV